MPAGGGFESDEFSPNIPQLGRHFKGPKFNRYHKEANQKKDPFAKNPGVNAAISDPPPDMRLRPPMRGEIDKNDMGRNSQYKGQSYLPSWKRPNTISYTEKDKLDSKLVKPRLSNGDLRRGRNPNY